MTVLHPHTFFVNAALKRLLAAFVTSVAVGALGTGGSLAAEPAKFRTFSPAASASLTEEQIIRVIGLDEMLRAGDLVQSQTLFNRNTVSHKYSQRLLGYPVLGGGVTVARSLLDGSVTVYNSVARWRTAQPQIPRIEAMEAHQIAQSATGNPELRAPAASDPVILPLGGRPILCWRVRLPAVSPAADWEVLVDAGSGIVRQTEDRLQRLDATGWVFDPDPLTALQDTTLEDADDDAEAVPLEAYEEVWLRGINRGPNGWTLTGPYVSTAATQDRVVSRDGRFHFNRSQSGFEETMAYFHIDRCARRALAAGFDLPAQRAVLVNANGVAEDVSFYSPFTGILTTGRGGVDDAEDADVLIHEYGHVLLSRILPDWRGGESGLLSEGFCDYFAGDASLRSAPDFQPDLLFNWDGHNQFWAGRVLNSPLTYDQIQGMERHQAGQMWSSLLMEVRRRSGDADLWSWVTLDHLYRLGDSATVRDAAAALLASDFTYTGGRFRRHIVQACESRRIFYPGAFSPLISHEELPDDEAIQIPRRVVARISSRLPLDPRSLFVIYQFNQGEPDSLPLNSTGEPNLYECRIPPPGQEAAVRYHLAAADCTGVTATLPDDAPLEWFEYYWGIDRVPPVIVELDSLPDTVFPTGEIRVNAVVTDNLGVASAAVEWRRGWGRPGGRVQLMPVGGENDRFSGKLHWSLNDEQVVLYRLVVQDEAETPNFAIGDYRSFTVRNEAIVDDFESEARRWQMEGWRRSSDNPRQGGYSLTDRAEARLVRAKEAVAQMDELWRFAGLGRARLNFWECHEYRTEGGFGSVEVSADSGRTWRELFRNTGSQPWWTEREMNLDDFARQNSPPLLVRFISHLPAGASEGEGWSLDDLRLRVGNIVAVVNGSTAAESAPFLSPPWPNPANGNFILRVQLPAPGLLSLMDIAGRTLMSSQLAAGERLVHLPTADLPAGAYLLYLQADGFTSAQPVFILR